MQPPPLLQSFFGDEGGCVVYKGYPPQRADDVQALLELARVLPPEVKFMAAPPEASTVQDLRHLLPALLADLSLLQDRVPKTNSGSIPDASPGSVEELLMPLLRSAIEEVSKGTILPEAIWRELKEWFPNLAKAMQARLIASPSIQDKCNAPEQENPRADLRSAFLWPGHGPVLIIGRPELLVGYREVSGEEPSSFREMLDDASYPGRYRFTQQPWISGANANEIMNHETKEHRSSRKSENHDVGFIHIGRTPVGCPVMVATGTWWLGTLAAARILLDRDLAFRLAAKESSANSKRRVDIGFECHLEKVSSRWPFPLEALTWRLRIEPWL